MQTTQMVEPAGLSLLRHDEQATTITAQDMARLTGLGRERLRTWERRFSFPVPVRSSLGNRSYLRTDVRRVAVVRQLARQGVPLAEAIATVTAGGDVATAGIPSLGVALDAAAAPALALTGPAPLEVVWTNTASRDATAGHGAPATLDQLEATLGSGATDALQQLLVGETDRAELIVHQDWTNPAHPTVCSIAWRVSQLGSAVPVVVLMQLEAVETDTPAWEAITETPELAGRCVGAVREARAVLAAQSGLKGVQRSLRGLTDELGAVDGVLAFQREGLLHCATSVRGVLAARVTPLAECPTAQRLIESIQIGWLPRSSARAVGLPQGVHGLLVPLAVGGMAVGGVILGFGATFELDDLAEELLLGYGTVVAALVLRDQAAAEALYARRASRGRGPAQTAG